MSDSNSTLRSALRCALSNATLANGAQSRSMIHQAVRPLAMGAITACVAFAQIAQAQQAPATEQTLRAVKAKEEAEQVVVPVTQVGKTPQLLRDVPQTITVLDRAVLDAQGATTLGEALRNVPGITLSAGEGGVIGDNINLRGFSARTDLYVDGLRDRGQYSRETAFLESVEVLKGPSSMLFGRGSTGGVINQVTKQPRRRESADVSGSVGTNSYYRIAGDINHPIAEDAAIRITAFGHRNESTRDVTESERYGIAPSLRLGIGTGTEFILSAALQRRDDIPDYGFPLTAGTIDNPGRPIETDRDNFYGFTNDSFQQDVDMLTARFSHEVSQAITIRNQTQFSSARINAKPTRVTIARVRERLEREIEDESFFNQTDLVFKFGSDALRSTITTGVELGTDKFENQTYSTTGEEAPLASFDNPVNGPIPANIVRTKNTFTDNGATTLAVYLNEQLDIGDQWKLIAGARWDQFDFDTKVTDASGAVTTNASQTDKMTSVRGGVVYQPDAVQTYYVSYGTSFNPSAEALTLSAANTNIDPEENRSYELGAKWSFSDNQVLATAALFRVDKTNARTSDPLLGVTLDGEVRVQGAELSISGPITKEWRVLAGYTYLDGEILQLAETGTNGGVRDGNVLPNTPKHNATLWTTYDLPHGFQVGGGLIYATDRLLNNANTAMVEGYARADATVAYIAKRYSVRLNLQNLTDEYYFDVASAGRATPAQGRAALATATWSF